jgi:hypothetical protein
MSCDHTCILSTDQLAVVARGIRKSSGITVSSKFRLVRYPVVHVPRLRALCETTISGTSWMSWGEALPDGLRVDITAEEPR